MWFGRLFEASGHQVKIIDKEDWPVQASDLVETNLVIISVPIDVTLTAISELPELPADCILADVTSTKTAPLKAMLEKHPGPVVGLHPMFGPDVQSLTNQTIIVSEGRQPAAYDWLMEQFEAWGGQLSHTSAEDHDHAMALIQVMRHFSTVAYGNHLKAEGANLGQITELSSPIYRLELAMVGRLFAQDPGLYTEIIFSNPGNVQMMRRYSERFSELLDLVESGDKAQFMQRFTEISDWFGDYAKQFLTESAGMLAYKKHLK